MECVSCFIYKKHIFKIVGLIKKTTKYNRTFLKTFGLNKHAKFLHFIIYKIQIAKYNDLFVNIMTSTINLNEQLFEAKKQKTNEKR